MARTKRSDDVNEPNPAGPGNEPIDKPVNPTASPPGGENPGKPQPPPAQAHPDPVSGSGPAASPTTSLPGFSPEQSSALAALIRDAIRANMGAPLGSPGEGGQAGAEAASYRNAGIEPPRVGDFDPDAEGGGVDPPRMTTAPTNAGRPDTPNNDFIHGVKGKLKYQLPGGSVYTVFDVEQYTFDDDVAVDDITNTSANGGQIVLDGIQKITGTVMFVYDSFNVPWVATNPFKPRTYCSLKLLLDGVTELAFVALMHGFASGSGPKFGTVRITARFQSSGPITYPSTSQTTATPALTS